MAESMGYNCEHRKFVAEPSCCKNTNSTANLKISFSLAIVELY